MTAPPPDTSEAPGNLLVPEPAVRTGALIGYARVSTSGQLLDRRQQHALAEAGCLRVFADELSGKDAERPELAACLDYLRPGDTLVLALWASCQRCWSGGVWPMKRICPCKAPVPGDSTVISIVRNSRGSTPVVIGTVADPELSTMNVPPLTTTLVLADRAHQHS